MLFSSLPPAALIPAVPSCTAAAPSQVSSAARQWDASEQPHRTIALQHTEKPYLLFLLVTREQHTAGVRGSNKQNITSDLLVACIDSEPEAFSAAPQLMSHRQRQPLGHQIRAMRTTRGKSSSVFFILRKKPCISANGREGDRQGVGSPGCRALRNRTTSANSELAK